MVRNNVIKSKKGRFVSALPKEKEELIKSLIKDPTVSIPEIARRAGVSPDAVLARRGARLSVRQAQEQYFKILKKDYVFPVVKEMTLSARVVSVSEVLRKLEEKYKGKFSKTLVSRAIEEIAKDGLQFVRPREYYEALALAKRKNEAWKQVDDLIVQFRTKAPKDWRDEQIVAEINEHLPEGKKIGYNTFRKRITVLKKQGLLQKTKRGYLQ
jgi:DNA-binding Lrp family transcriptional regulator